MQLSRKTGVILAIAVAACLTMQSGAARAQNLVQDGSFENGLASWNIGGAVGDGYLPVAIAYGQSSQYPTGAQGEIVPTDNAASAGPDAAGRTGVYFVSDQAQNLGVYQSVFLNPGSYDIGFDSYDTINGSVQPNDATLTANILGVNVASFALSSVTPGVWSTHFGVAQISSAGTYLVSFAFTTAGYPVQANSKDVVIDRAYVVADANGGGTPIPAVPVPEPSAWVLMAGFLLGLVVFAKTPRRLLRVRA